MSTQDIFNVSPTKNELTTYTSPIILPSIPTPKPLNLSGWLAARASHDEVRRAMVEVTREQCRALLAKVALENAGALSALEQHLYKTAPFGEIRYQQIADAYAIGAAAKIMRW